MEDDETALHEQPLEFMTSIANLGGGHDGQWVIPNDHGTFEVGCACEKWLLEAPTQERGLELARMHTGSIPSDGGDLVRS